MEGCMINESPTNYVGDNHVKKTDSALNFQKFIYDLFERNGILNDLRAYLRGHIVDVLKSAQTGEPPACQKHYTQRLELTYQALNILIAEYLLRLDFSYSLSVFVSEIPLANMVFSFAKNLMSNKGNFEDLKFKENDVWSILNYLGIKCDSEHASLIVEMYNGKDNLPLIYCILKCIPMYKNEPCYEEKAILSSESLCSSERSIKLPEKQAKSASKACSYEKCKHYVFCKTCQAKISRLKEKYKTKKKHIIKMFQQLKEVYEAEVEMMRQEEENKIKRSIASHALLLRKRKDEMEESFKAREEELERNVQEKKKFLWGLAKALREQHANMAAAMQAVRHETDRLSVKENSLKTQLLEAEQVLRERGEEMRKQISSELLILEEHLESMKRERQNIYRERTELDNIKASRNNNCIIKDLNNEELKSHYDMIKDELSILKNYLEKTKLEPKCVIERSTLTELYNVSSKLNIVLNNGHEDASKVESEDRLRNPNQVVNDLKKQKNVNFCTPNVDDLYREGERSRSRSTVSSEGIDRLREENERLRTFARQQREHIDELSSQQARLRAELVAARFRGERPRTAPAMMPAYRDCAGRLNTAASVNSVGWQKGAGEEMSVFANAQPRILLPGDILPFIGVLRDRHGDNRRHLIDQWRALRKRTSPNGGVVKQRTHLQRERFPRDVKVDSTAEDLSPAQEDSKDPCVTEPFTFKAEPLTRERPKIEIHNRNMETHQTREKSPKSVLREAKEKLKNKNYTREPATIKREKSPNAVLKEAKLRLRKLEIEAEAVEKSYLDFRRRQSEIRQGRSSQLLTEVEALDIEKRLSSRRIDVMPGLDDTPFMSTVKHRRETGENFDHYLFEYQNKLNAGASHFGSPRKTSKSKPIPSAYSKIETDEIRERWDNYLETPLSEFRKLYSQKSIPISKTPVQRTKSLEKPTEVSTAPDSEKESTESKIKSARSVKSNEELEILKDNVSKMYNIKDKDEIEQKIEGVIVKNESPKSEKEASKLIVEVEHVSESNSLKIPDSNEQDLLLIVESTIETRDVDASDCEIHKEQISTHMTIIVSPKQESVEKSQDKLERSMSPEQAAHLTRNDVLDAIFHADASKRSSIEMELNISKDMIKDSSDGENGEDYPDDFSADVDNYNSRSEYNNSPISLPKNSEDDNFWDP